MQKIKTFTILFHCNFIFHQINKTYNLQLIIILLLVHILDKDSHEENKINLFQTITHLTTKRWNIRM